MRSKKAIAFAALLSLGLAACNGGGGGVVSVPLQLTLKNVPTLGSGFAYEGWLIVNGQPVSTGRFNVDANSVPNQSALVPYATASGASKFVLTIERDGVPGPSATHFLAGSLAANGNERDAAISISDPAALGTDFHTASGSFILATPTDPSNTNPLDGIWWVNNGAAGLSLPTLPQGWKYEGWVVVNGAPISTGRFTSPSGADSDGAGPQAGPGAAPSFPGQDFVNPPTNLTGAKAVISVEPEPAVTPHPFVLKPLLTNSIQGVALSPQTMQNTVGDGSSLPSGSVRLPLY